MGSNCPSHNAQPFGGNPKLMIRISLRNGSATAASSNVGGFLRRLWNGVHGRAGKRKVRQIHGTRLSCSPRILVGDFGADIAVAADVQERSCTGGTRRADLVVENVADGRAALGVAWAG